jgi:hypothetical protein
MGSEQAKTATLKVWRPRVTNMQHEYGKLALIYQSIRDWISLIITLQPSAQVGRKARRNAHRPFHLPAKSKKAAVTL